MASNLPPEENDKRLRIVLLGKTGAGKSTLGNQLIAPSEKKFKIRRGLRSGTTKSGWLTTTRDGYEIQVVDTPGLCDTHLTEELIKYEVAKSVALAAPGPHVFLFMLRCDRRFTKEELRAYRTIKETFSDEMNKYLILVFNGLDTFREEDEKTMGGEKIIEDLRAALEKDIRGFGGDLNLMIEEANGRYIGMDNTALPPDSIRQTNDLIDMIRELKLNNGGKYFTSPQTTEIKEKIDEYVHQLSTEENITRSQAEITLKEKIAEEKASSAVMNFLEKLVFYLR